MRGRMIARYSAGPILLGLLVMLSVAGFKCGGGKEPIDKVNRLVLVVDPTVLRDVNAADFNRQLGAKLHASVKHLPEDTHVDLYFVGVGQGGLPADYRAFLPFDGNDPTEENHKARAKSLADTVVSMVRSRWAASNEQPNDPSSCILTALYRAQEMTALGAKRKEDVTLFVVSDFLEACADTGYNFERAIPDSVGTLPVQADLSGADRVVMLRMQTSGAVRLKDETRLIRVWTDLLKHWKADTTAVEFTPNFPETLVTTPSRSAD